MIIKLYLIIGLLISAYGTYRYSKYDEFHNYPLWAVVVGDLLIAVIWPYLIWKSMRDTDRDGRDSEKTES